MFTCTDIGLMASSLHSKGPLILYHIILYKNMWTPDCYAVANMQSTALRVYDQG